MSLRIAHNNIPREPKMPLMDDEIFSVIARAVESSSLFRSYRDIGACLDAMGNIINCSPSLPFFVWRLKVIRSLMSLMITCSNILVCIRENAPKGISPNAPPVDVLQEDLQGLCDILHCIKNNVCNEVHSGKFHLKMESTMSAEPHIARNVYGHERCKQNTNASWKELCEKCFKLSLVYIRCYIGIVQEHISSWLLFRLAPKPPLNAAALRGDAMQVRELLANGDDPNERDVCLATALHAAVLGGDVDIVRQMIASGACLDARDGLLRTPLQLAVLQENVKVVDLLLRRGADPNIPDIHKNSPLYVAVIRKNALIARSLLSHNATCNAKNCFDFPIEWATARSGSRYLQINVAKGCSRRREITYGLNTYSANCHGRVELSCGLRLLSYMEQLI